MRGGLGLREGTIPDAAERTARWQRELVRERVGAVLDPDRARVIAEEAIRAAAEVKNHPPDLINVALELLVQESLELPGFPTLSDGGCGSVRRSNTALFERSPGAWRRWTRIASNALLEVAGPSRKSGLTR